MRGQEEEVGGGGGESNQPVAPPSAPFTVCLSPWPDSGTAPVWEEPSKVSPLLPPAAHHNHRCRPAPPALRSLDTFDLGRDVPACTIVFPLNPFFVAPNFLIVARFVQKVLRGLGGRAKWGRILLFVVLFGVHANCPNFAPL